MDKADKTPHPLSRFLHTLGQALDVGILLLDGDLSLNFANEQAGALFGYASAEELASQWPALRPSIIRALEQAVAGKESESGFDMEFSAGGAVRRLRLEAYPLAAEDEKGEGGDFLLLVRNRELIDALETDLRLAARFRSLTRLFASMAHDLKAPLNALTINLDLLKTILSKNPPPDPMTSERQQRYLKVLSDELVRLNQSLQNLVNQTLPAKDTEQSFDLRELLLDLISLIAPQARRQQVAVEVQMDESPLKLDGQRDLLKQALINIAINALEAMAEGGRFNIELETKLGQAIIHFRDTGPGIPQEVLERIWEMHFTTKNTGTGIGLYVARSVIESFGGTIWVETGSGHGTSFIISLPISSKEAS